MKAISFIKSVFTAACSVFSLSLKFAGMPVILILVLGIPLRSTAQNETLPKAESLFEAFTRVTGGQPAYDIIQKRITKSRMVMSMPPISGEVTAYLTRSGLYYVSIDSTGIGKIEYGSDGKVVWENNPMTGAAIREGQEKSRFRCLYSLDLPSRWQSAFKKLTVAGIDTVDGKPAYKVEAVTLEDYSLVYYFEKSSSLIIKAELPTKTLAGQGIQEIFYSDYKAADGILFPFTQRRVEQGRVMTLTFFNVSQNPDIPEGVFVLPDYVRKIAGTAK